MADVVARTPWGWRAGFALAVLAILFLRLLPLGGEAGRLPGPDLVLCIACAWVLRRPDVVPAPLIAAMALVEDMLLMRPPGLHAALTLAATEFLRGRAIFMRELPFLGEWLMVAVAMTVHAAASQLVLAVAVVPQPGVGLVLVQLAATIAAYPLVVLATRFVFGMRKPATGEVDAMGRRL
jgi:rod shape-determining protein MreD